MFLDFEVAYKTLAQMESSQEIAEFLTLQNIKAEKFQSLSCAISEWMFRSTGVVSSTGLTGIRQLRSPDVKYPLTRAMYNFVWDFDNGWYPQLER